MMKKLFFFCLAIVTFGINPSWASDDEDEIFSQTLHEMTIGNRTITYTATIGSILVRADNGTETGKIYYTAYRGENMDNDAERPITFAFNGGPGSSSVWLHMGAFGPKRVMNPSEGQTVCPPYQIVENTDSILDLTDLVFIDPIGTGLSRTSEQGDPSYYNIDGDIESIGDFIRDYVTKEGRWKSPKYLAGESYGTLRACGVSEYLQTRHGLYLNGLILISCAIDYQTFHEHLDNELPYALLLPSLAATAWYHGYLDQSVSLKETVDQAKDFAINTFAPTFLRYGNIPNNLYPDLSHWTGLPMDLIEQHDGIIDYLTYSLNFLKKDKKVVGLYDTRILGDILPPRTIFNYIEPSSTAVTGMYTASLQAYLHDELGFEADWPRYEILGDLPWDLSSFGYPNTMNHLRSSLVMNPNIKIFAACGYFDLITPFAATEHCFQRLHLPCENNVTFGYYEGGHMFYTNLKALKQFKADLTNFYLKK